MLEPDLAALAEEWIAYWLLPEASRRVEVGGAGDHAWDLCQDAPEKAFEFVLQVLRQNHTSHILEVLSAGPLEDILTKHGERMIDRVEAEARSNPIFATLLGGVWQNEMSDEVWRRVQAVWDRRGWDGISGT